MQRKSTQGNNYHIIVSPVDQRLTLILTQDSGKKSNQSQKHQLQNIESSIKRTLVGVFSTDLYKQISQSSSAQIKTFSCNTNPPNTVDKSGVKQQTKYGQLKKTKDTESEERAKSSIINDLIAMSSEGQGQTFKSEHFNGLESIQCIECTSIHEGDSYDFEQADSEIMSLTHQEKQFFHNFITPDHTENKQIDQLFDRLSLQTTQVIPQPTAKSLPQNKLKVIRNFFKPKEGAIKDQKNQCDSIVFLEEIMSKLKGNKNCSQMRQDSKIANSK